MKRRWTVLLVDGNGRKFPAASGYSRFRAWAVMAICLLTRPERHELHWRSVVEPYGETGETR